MGFETSLLLTFSGECEQRVENYRSRMLNQQSTIRIRREEGKRCEEEAKRLKREADSACIRGTMNRELGLPNNNLLQEAERKQREALAKETDARNLEKLASEGEKNIHRLADQLLVNARQRQDVERERQIEESRVSEIAQNLERYKWEIGNCQTAARRLRDEEARLDRESNEKLDLAERAEAAAKQLEQEAARLEREAASGSSW